MNDHSILIFIQKVREFLEELQKDADIGFSLRNLFNKSDQLYKEIPGVRRRIRRLARTINVPSAKLTIQGFGRTQVKVGEKLLTMSDWQTQSVRDLFFYFLSVDKPMTKEQIGSVFWPEIEEPSRLKMRFKNDIYRLRRAVGSDIILYENDLYSFNRTSDYEYDVEAFGGLLFQSRLAKNPNVRIELLQKSVNLVHGPLLEDIYTIWVEPERERLKQVFLAALLELADLLKNTNQVYEALNTYQQAIDYDPTFESAYLLAMKLYAQLNDRSNTLRLYDAYTEMMKQELDLPPSAEIEAVFKRLMH